MALSKEFKKGGNDAIWEQIGENDYSYTIRGMKPAVIAVQKFCIKKKWYYNLHVHTAAEVSVDTDFDNFDYVYHGLKDITLNFYKDKEVIVSFTKSFD